MNHDQSHALFSRAQELLPGGVNSPVRAFKSVGGEPFFVERADGAYLYDVDGNRYIDYVGSWGPMIVGHNHTAVRQAVKKAIERVTTVDVTEPPPPEDEPPPPPEPDTAPPPPVAPPPPPTTLRYRH